MALDRAIQMARAAEKAPPTLRVYTWRCPTVTLGRFQDAGCLDWDACARHGVEAARRFTGGRGVLHDDEVTYSVVASVTDGIPRGVSASYRHLCIALVEAYRRLGVDASLTTLSRGNPRSAACYLSASEADVSAGELKLSGSAQTWMGETVLQHGSFTITRDAVREADVFGMDPDARAKLAETTGTLADLLCKAPSCQEVVAAVVSGFEDGLRVVFTTGAQTAEEEAMAGSLMNETVIARRR